MTPPLGIYSRNWGSAKHDIADGVHRPLCVYACVLGSDLETLRVILTLDLMTWCSREDEFGIRAPVLKEFGLREDQLMMHISHNHSAPLTDMVFKGKMGGQFIAPYRKFLVETLIGCIKKALSSRTNSVLSWQVGSCRLAYNRDFPHPDTGEIICGINPGHPADDTVLVGRVTNEAGKITAVLINYACHPTTLGGANTKLSPDYPGAMRAMVESEYEDSFCLFLHGASGDLGPRNGYVGDTKIADQNGRELGFAALSALESMMPPAKQLAFEGVQSSGTNLGIWKTQPYDVHTGIKGKLITLDLDVKDTPCVAQLKQDIENSNDRAEIERFERMMMVSQFIDGHKSLPLKLWVWRIGNSFIVGTPTEMHSEFQIKLRGDHPDVHIAVLNIVNGYTSYLPPREDYPTKSYQVNVSVFKAGAAEKVRVAVTAQIEKMKS
jgi:hypothetical protein